MARDYKSRAQDKNNWRSNPDYRQKSSLSLWKWMLLIAVIILIAVGLAYLITKLFKKDENTSVSIAVEQQKDPKSQAEDKAVPVVDLGPKPPQFDFYTILPDKEVIVPEYEIKTRAREERVGKAKETHYVMQAGSFKTAKEADELRLKLAAMGIESKIDKSKMGDVNWYRVKMGPYTQTESVNTVQSRLRKNGIDVLVTEGDK